MPPRIFAACQHDSDEKRLPLASLQRSGAGNERWPMKMMVIACLTSLVTAYQADITCCISAKCTAWLPRATILHCRVFRHTASGRADTVDAVVLTRK